ncbi:hypothetical protein [Demequina subtropica]|uniref:hypothetical protein n=1 Tax=Demequina subtropica TaxID=1638989 RepID=UPI0007822913|nr:hypothetical protein [Demequina subtropica]
MLSDDILVLHTCRALLESAAVEAARPRAVPVARRPWAALRTRERSARIRALSSALAHAQAAQARASAARPV